MFETFGFEDFTARQAAIVLGLALGLAFGALAEVTRFCLRRAVAGPASEQRSALGVWLAALGAAIVATQAARAAGIISFADHRFMATDLPVAAIIVGGLMFGFGMVLTRGCISRLTVLTGSGNLRALSVLVVFAITAHAALKGVLAPVRTALGSVTLPLESASLADLPGGAPFWATLLVVAAFGIALRSGARPRDLIGALFIGVIAAAGWVGTGFVLYDEFDPIAMESLSFTLPSAETLFWGVASSAIPAGFGVGLIGGVIVGAAILSLISGRFAWQSFSSPAETGRYMLGAVLMGLGGVLAGGCTVGAGMSGVPTLSIAAMLAIGAIALGGVLGARLVNGPSRAVSGAPEATRSTLPAE